MPTEPGRDHEYRTTNRYSLNFRQENRWVLSVIAVFAATPYNSGYGWMMYKIISEILLTVFGSAALEKNNKLALKVIYYTTFAASMLFAMYAIHKNHTNVTTYKNHTSGNHEAKLRPWRKPFGLREGSEMPYLAVLFNFVSYAGGLTNPLSPEKHPGLSKNTLITLLTTIFTVPLLAYLLRKKS